MTIRKNGSFLDFIRVYLEYALVILIILECNSLFGQSENNNDGVWFWTYVYNFCLITAFAVLSLLVYKVKSLKPLLSILPVLAFYYILALIFFFFNVLKLAPDKTQDYVMRFLMFLPLMICLFRYDREIGDPFAIWFRYSDVMVLFSALNIIVFFFLTFFPDVLQSEPVQTLWTGHLKSLLNFYNIIAVQLGVFREVFGLKLFRNFSIFTEPLMFCIPLITALSTELFLSPQRKGWLWRSVVLSIAIFTAQSDFAFILTIMIWGLKIILLLPSKYRHVLFPVIIFVVVSGCFIVFWRKGRFYGTDELSSLGMHLMDYKFGLMALREKPLLGGGYWNDRFISGFMPADRFAKNPGLSNTFAVVLGEGGILFGIICMLPYLIGLLQFFHKKNRFLAFWTIGIFGIYVGIIFRFRLYLLLVLSFGYSLVDFEIARHKLSLFPNLYQNMEGLSVRTRFTSRKPLSQLMFIGGCLLILILLRRFLFSLAYAFLNAHRFLLGQSVWKTLLFLFITLFFICFSSYIWKDTVFFKHKLFLVISISLISAIFFLLYPCVSELINAILVSFRISAEPWESILLLFLYILVLFIPIESITFRRAIKCHKSSVVIVSLTAIFVLWFGTSKISSVIHYQSESIPEEELQVISDIGAIPGSKLYSNHNAALYHKRNPDIRFTAAKDQSFSKFEQASIIFPDGSDLPELFNAGYQVTRISDRSLLYSNDNAVINDLTLQGYAFYRYYPYPTHFNMGYAAQLNNLERSKSGGILLDGKDRSLLNGPYDQLDAGTYTVSYKLYPVSDIGSLSSAELVCTLQISCDNGATVIAQKEVYADDCPNTGAFEATLQFKSSDIRNVEYRIIAEDGICLEVEEISICKTPDAIMLYEYDSLNQPTKIQYYDADGKPKQTDDGCFALAYTYDHFGRIISQRFLDLDGMPTLTKNGYSEIRFERNLYGYITRESYYGADGDLILIPAGFSVIERDYEHDGKVLIAQRYLDTDLKPVMSSDGYAECKYTYDGKNRVIKEEYFDASGSPVTRPDGYAAVEYEYDSSGNKTVFRYFNVNGVLTVRKEGYSVLHRIYNKNHQIITESFFDADYKPTVMPGGYSAANFEYDAEGNRVGFYFFDTTGLPVIREEGYSILRRTYNEKRQIVFEEYYGLDNNPILISSGYSAVKYKYDDSGNRISYLFLDPHRHPIITKNGYAEIRYTYDENGVIQTESFYDTDGNEVFPK